MEMTTLLEKTNIPYYLQNKIKQNLDIKPLLLWEN